MSQYVARPIPDDPLQYWATHMGRHATNILNRKAHYDNAEDPNWLEAWATWMTRKKVVLCGLQLAPGRIEKILADMRRHHRYSVGPYRWELIATNLHIIFSQTNGPGSAEIHITRVETGEPLVFTQVPSFHMSAILRLIEEQYSAGTISRLI